MVVVVQPAFLRFSRGIIRFCNAEEKKKKTGDRHNGGRLQSLSMRALKLFHPDSRFALSGGIPFSLQLDSIERIEMASVRTCHLEMKYSVGQSLGPCTCKPYNRLPAVAAFVSFWCGVSGIIRESVTPQHPVA